MEKLIKAIIWDIDGVLIRQKEYYDSFLERQGYFNPKEILNEFRCTQLNKDCDSSKFDPLIEITPFLNRIGWKGTNEEYFFQQYEFESQFIDYTLIENIQNFRKNGIKSFIASNQNYYRKNYLMNKLKIEKTFDKAYFSCDFGLIKPEPNYWKYVITDIIDKYNGISIYNLLFLDDRFENIQSALDYGIKSVHIKTENDITNVLLKIEKNA